MTQVEQIKADIESLSQEDFDRLRKWFVDKDWKMWDAQIAEDSTERKLDFLMEEAMQAKAEGTLQDL